MKRNILFTLAIFAFVLTFAACSKKAGTDENGYCQTLDEAKKAAAEKNQDILVVVTLAGNDEASDSFLNDIFYSEAFTEKVAQKYVIFHIDFGEATYNKTLEDEKFAALMEKNTLVASNLNVRFTPCFYLLSKEGYFITQLEYMDEITSADQIQELISLAAPACDDVHNIIAKIQAATGSERILAIDELVNMTELTYKFFIYDLIKEVIKLDKDNTYGMIGKYLLYKVDLDATELFGKGEPERAAKCYADVALSPYLDADQKQQSYYMAAYSLFMGHVEDPKPILNYLQKAIDVNPDSPNTPQIRQQLESMAQTIAATEVATY